MVLWSLALQALLLAPVVPPSKWQFNGVCGVLRVRISLLAPLSLLPQNTVKSLECARAFGRNGLGLSWLQSYKAVSKPLLFFKITMQHHRLC